jgi:hypothetical protein
MMWQGEQLVLGCGRLLDHDVEPGPADPVGDQCIMERVLVDHRAAAGIDQDRRRFHQPQLAHPDQFVCRGIQRHVQGDDVRAPQQLGKQRKAHVERVFGIAAEPGDVVILDAHMERLCEARHLLADVAEPDHAERLVLELVEHDRRHFHAAKPAAARPRASTAEHARRPRPSSNRHCCRSARFESSCFLDQRRRCGVPGTSRC